MKKSFLYSLAAFAGIAFASCNGDYDDWSQPQHNDQESAITIPGFNATAANAINLANPGTDVTVFHLSEAALPENMTLENIHIVITPAEEESATSVVAQNIDATSAGTVDSTALQNAVLSAYGRRPSARLFNAHAYADVMSNGQALFVDAGKFQFTVTPKAPHISKGYYLAGDMTTWGDFNALGKFSHSGKDVYEDPVFTLTITTTADNQYWKIIPQENVDAQNFWADGVLGTEVDGSTDATGTLVTTNPQAGKIAEAGTYVITLDMLEYSYSITKADSYYMVGGVYGWNAEAASKLAFFCEGGSKASITTQWTGDANLKIWAKDDIGNWDKAWGTATDGDKSASGSLTNSGSQAFVCPEKGAFYTLTIDMSSKEYTWTKLDNQEPASYSTIGLIGGFNSWGADVAMEQTAPHNWFVRHTFSSDTEMKFRANAAWDVSWGGTAETLAGMVYPAELGSSNLNIKAGTYDIYFNDITGQFLFVSAK